MKAVKAVSFAYDATPQTRELLCTFREMVNEAIRICLAENIHGRFRLRNRVYSEFRERFGVGSGFPYSVAEVAWSIVKKQKRWHRKPFAKRLMLKIEASKSSVKNSMVSIPFKHGQRIFIPIRYGEYQRSFLRDSSLKRGSITITESSVIIAFSKQVKSAEPLTRVGYDLNEKSLVGSDGFQYDLAEVARLHTLYGIRRSKFSARHPDDLRLKKKFSSLSREKVRVNQVLHRVSRLVVSKAGTWNRAIVLERLKGIRFSHNKGTPEGKTARRRIALWPFRRLQAFIEYKAMWAGVRVEYVSASYTSKTCHRCGYVNKKLKLTERSWLCPQCGCQLDRDLNAAINVERRGKTRCLGEIRPGAQDTDEAMKGNEATIAPILRAEVLKSGPGFPGPD